MSDDTPFNEDFLDILEALSVESVEFVIVGAHAVAVHGTPRATGDLDLFVRPTRENAARIFRALKRFGAPLEAHNIKEDDFSKEHVVYQMGLPPRRIDLLTSVSGVTFEEAWADRVVINAAGLELPFLGKRTLVKNKVAAGRDKDLVDVRLLTKK